MSLPDKCPFCGAAIAIGEDGKKRVADLIVIFDCGSGFDELIDPIRTRSRACKAITRVAELEAENKTLRDRFSDADTERNAAQAALKAAFARVAELEAREKQAREDEAWAKQNLAYVSMGEDGCWAGMYDRDASEERGLVERFDTIADALSALRDMVEGGAR